MIRSAGMNGQRGLDGLNFLVGMLQTGFGAFVPAFLSLNGWSQVEIGTVLGIETIASMVSQVPGGALVDMTQHRRPLLSAAILAIGGTALLLALLPGQVPVLIALCLHDFASAIATPAIAAVSLLLVGQAALAERLGHNVRYAALGSMIGAAVMGACDTWLSTRAVFLLVAAMAIAAQWPLKAIPLPHRDTSPQTHGHMPEHTEEPLSPWLLLHDRRLLSFVACVFLFQVASAAIVPLSVADLARHSFAASGLIIAAFVLVPQILVVVAAPTVGRRAESHGRRPLLMLGFAAMPLRAALFAVVHDPYLLVAVQILEGVGAATFGVMVPLMAADLTRGTGRYNLLQGVLGLVAALGAAVSTTLGGAMADAWGLLPAYWMLAAIGGAGILAVAALTHESHHRVAALHVKLV
jgi:MFS family permease